MNPKGMLRRTLAMLLVLIFALSNMGLAEMADAVADSIPAEVPQIEEVAEEAAPVEEQAEEAAPVEEETVPAEDEADEAEAPAEGTPAEGEASVEDAEAESPAVTLSVEAYLLDEDSIFADATTDYEGELTYQWQRAAVGSEEWEAIEGATEWIYVNTDEDRAAYAYRCVVTAGDIVAETNAVQFDTVEFAADLTSLESDFELADVNANATYNLSTALVLPPNPEPGLVYNTTDCTNFKYTTRVRWNPVDGQGAEFKQPKQNEKIWYKWEITGAAATKEILRFPDDVEGAVAGSLTQTSVIIEHTIGQDEVIEQHKSVPDGGTECYFLPVSILMTVATDAATKLGLAAGQSALVGNSGDIKLTVYSENPVGYSTEQEQAAINGNKAASSLPSVQLRVCNGEQLTISKESLAAMVYQGQAGVEENQIEPEPENKFKGTLVAGDGWNTSLGVLLADATNPDKPVLLDSSYQGLVTLAYQKSTEATDKGYVTLNGGTIAKVAEGAAEKLESEQQAHTVTLEIKGTNSNLNPTGVDESTVFGTLEIKVYRAPTNYTYTVESAENSAIGLWDNAYSADDPAKKTAMRGKIVGNEVMKLKATATDETGATYKGNLQWSFDSETNLVTETFIGADGAIQTRPVMESKYKYMRYLVLNGEDEAMADGSTVTVTINPALKHYNQTKTLSGGKFNDCVRIQLRDKLPGSPTMAAIDLDVLPGLEKLDTVELRIGDKPGQNSASLSMNKQKGTPVSVQLVEVAEDGSETPLDSRYFDSEKHKVTWTITAVNPDDATVTDWLTFDGSNATLADQTKNGTQLKVAAYDKTKHEELNPTFKITATVVDGTADGFTTDANITVQQDEADDVKIWLNSEKGSVDADARTTAQTVVISATASDTIALVADQGDKIIHDLKWRLVNNEVGAATDKWSFFTSDDVETANPYTLKFSNDAKEKLLGTPDGKPVEVYADYTVNGVKTSAGPFTITVVAGGSADDVAGAAITMDKEAAQPITKDITVTPTLTGAGTFPVTWSLAVSSTDQNNSSTYGTADALAKVATIDAKTGVLTIKAKGEDNTFTSPLILEVNAAIKYDSTAAAKDVNKTIEIRTAADDTTLGFAYIINPTIASGKTIDDVTDGWTDFSDTTGLNVGVGDKLYLKAVPDTGYAGEAEDWSVMAGVDEIEKDVEISAKGVLTVPTDTEGDLIIEVAMNTGATKQIKAAGSNKTISVLPKATNYELVATDTGTTIVYYDADALDTATKDIDLKLTGKTADGKAGYIGKLKWALTDRANSGAFSLEDEETAAGTDTNTLLIKGKLTSAQNLTITITPEGGSAKSFTFTVLSDTVEGFNSNMLSLENLKPLDADENETPTHLAQGSSVNAVISNTWYNQSLNRNYPLEIKISKITGAKTFASAGSITQDEDIAKWFDTAAGTAANRATFTAKSVPAFKDTDPTKPENLIKDAELTVTVTAQIKGIPDAKAEQTFMLVPVPASAKIVEITNAGNAGAKDDEASSYPLTGANAVLLKGDTILLRAEPVGPQYTDGDQTKPLGDVTFEITEGSGTVVRSLTGNTNVPAVATGDHVKYLKLEAIGAGKATVTATPVDNPDGKVQVTFTVGDETSDPNGFQIDPTTYQTPIPGHTHKWALCTGDDDDHAPTAEGHFYKCVTDTDGEGTLCGAYTLAVPHASFTTTEKYVMAGKYDLTGDQFEANTYKVVCELCQYECKHTNLEKGETERYDETYHIITCPDCGQKFIQEHKDDYETGFCTICKEARAKAEFLQKSVEVTIDNTKGVDIDSLLQVTGASNWDVVYSQTAGETFATLNANTGIVIPTGTPMGEGDKVTIQADVTVVGEDVSKALPAATIDVYVTQTPEADVTITASKTWLKESAAVQVDDAIQLTASVEGLANPDFTGYRWEVEGADTATPSKFVFYGSDPTDTTSGEAAQQLSDTTNVKTVWLVAENTAALDPDKDGLKVVFQKYNDEGKVVADAKKGELAIDYMPAYGANKSFELKIVDDKETVGQGDTLTVEMPDYNENYGVIKYKIEEAAASATMTEGAIRKWAEGQVVDGKFVITVKEPTTAENTLSASAPSKAFKVTAEIYKAADDAQPIMTSNSNNAPTFTIVSAPAGATFSEIDTATETTTPDQLAPIAGQKKTVYQGDVFYVAAKTVGPAVATGTTGATLETVVKDLEVKSGSDDAFTVTPVQKTGTDGKKQNTGVWKVEVSATASGELSLITEDTYNGVHGTLPVTVLKTIDITALELTDKSLANVAAGEQDDSTAEGGPKKVIFAATFDPAIDETTDDVTWSITSKDGTNDAAALKALGIELTDVAGHDKDQKMIIVPSTLTRKVEVTVKVEAKHSFNADKTALKSKTCDVTFYPGISVGDVDSAIEVKAGGATMSNGDTVNLIKGNRIEIEPAYDSDHGSSTGVPALVITNEKINGQAADAKAVAEIVEETDATTNKTKYYVKANSAGTADLEIRAYNWREVGTDVQLRKVLHIIAEGTPEEVRLVDEELAKGFALGEKYEGSTKEILRSAFEVYQPATAEGGEPEKDTSDATIAKIQLTAEPAGFIEITENTDKTGWIVKGIAAGTTNITGHIGDCASAQIKVEVEPAPTGLEFYVDDEKQSTQILRNTEDLAAIKLQAKSVPEGAFGEITLEKDDPNEIVNYVADESDASIVTITPNGKAGTMRVIAKVYNKNYNANSSAEPEYLTKMIELVVADESAVGPTQPEEPSNYVIEFSGKSAIGKGEKTQAVLFGAAEGTTYTWRAAEGDEEFINVTENGEISWVKAGYATVEAIDESENVLQSADITTLTEIDGDSIVVSAPKQMSIGETVLMSVDDFTGYTEVDSEPEEDNYFDRTGLFTFDYADEASKSIVQLGYADMDDGSRSVTALAQGTANLKLSIVGVEKSIALPIAISSKTKATGFQIEGYADSTVYMKQGEEKTIAVTYLPKNKNAFMNLDWSVVPEDEGVTVESGKITVAENAEIGMNYDVTVTPAGMPNIAAQKFTVAVVGEPEGTLHIDVDKVGYDHAYGPNGVTAGEAVKLYKGEKLQAKVVDAEGNPVSGAITWKATKGASHASVTAAGVITAKSKGSATIRATANGTDYTISLKVSNAPSDSKLKIAPDNNAVRTVAAGEPFEVALDPVYTLNTSDWYKVTWDFNQPEECIDPEIEEVKKGWYVFPAEEFEGGEVAIATITTSWGKTKTVTYNIVTDKIAAEGDLSLPANVTIVKKGNVRIKASFAEDTYALLDWKVDGQAVTAKSTKVSTQSKLYVQTLSNDEIMITSKSAAVGKSVTVTATSHSDPEVTASTTVTVSAAGDAAMIPAGAKLAFEKNVIGVGEETSVTIVSADGEPLEDEEGNPIALPAGTLTFKAANKKGQPYVTEKNGKIKGVRPGMVEVTAYLNGAATQVKGSIMVLSKATMSLSINPTMMAEGEILETIVTIGGYAPTAALPEGYEIDTGDVLSVASDSERVYASLEPVFDEESETETEQNTHRYTLTLIASKSEKDAKGKFATTNVTLALNNGTKATKMKIQVVNATADYEVFVPDEMYIARGEKVTIPVAANGTDVAANFSWEFENPATAASYGLSFVSGKLQASSKAEIGQSVNLIGKSSNFYDGQYTRTVKVTIGKKVSKASQITVKLPKTTMGLGEAMQAKVVFTGSNVGGNVTWKSSKKAVATIDAKTGLIVAKTAGTTQITAKVNGKTSKKVALTVGAAPTAVKFKNDEYPLEAEKTYSLKDYVELTGPAATELKDETAYHFSIDTYNVYDEETEEDIAVVESFNDRTGEITIAKDAPSCVIKATVTTYNGLTDDCLLVIGEVKGDTPIVPPTPQKDTKPASLELWMDGELVDGEALHVIEEETLSIRAIVRNAAGIELTAEEATVEWTPADDEHVTIAADGTLTANKFTYDATTLQDVPVTVTATVKTDDPETTLTKSYTVTIAAKLREENINFDVPAGLVLHQPVSVTFSISGQGFNYLDPEIDVVEENSVGDVDITAVGTDYTIMGTKEGTVEIKISVKESDNATPVVKTVTTSVYGLPGTDDMTNNVSEGLTLGNGEQCEFTAAFAAGGKYDGIVLKKDVLSANTGVEFKVYEYDVATGELDSDESMRKLLTFVDQTDATGAAVDNTYVMTSNYSDDQATQKVRVKVFAYGSKTSSTEFDVILDASAPFELKAEPCKKDAPNGTIDVAADEKVTLTLTRKNNAWAGAPTWEITNALGAEIDDSTFTFEPVKGSDGMQYELTCASTISIKETVQITVKPTGTANDATHVFTGAEQVQMTVKFHALPAAGDTVTSNIADNEAKIGIGEALDVVLTGMDNDPEFYSTNVTWSTLSTDKLDVEGGYNAAGIPICKITGTGKTSTGTTAKVWAKIGSVIICELSVTVVDATSSIELCEVATKKTFDNTLTKNQSKAVYVALTEGTSSKCEIKIVYNGKDVTSTWAPGKSDKNAWTITPVGTVDSVTSARITISTGSLRKQYTAYIVAQATP